MNQTAFEIFSIIVSVVAFLFAAWLLKWVNQQPSSNKKVSDVGNLIREGAATFLKKEYMVLARFTAIVALIDRKSVV